jgi:uncharacterized protein (DUF2062 family)
MNFLLKYKPVVKLISKTKELLVSGNTPHQLSLAITLGIIFGVFPFLGVTTILLTVIALVLRLNMIVIQLTNYLVYPLQLMFYIPLIRFGIFLGKLKSVTASQVFDIMKENWIEGIEKLWIIHAWAILAWVIISIPVSYIVYNILKILINRLKRKVVIKPITHTPDSN